MIFSFERVEPLAKPCPFCGNAKIVTESRESFDKALLRVCTFLRCTGCGAKIVGEPLQNEDGTMFEDYEVALSQALRMWNRRTA